MTAASGLLSHHVALPTYCSSNVIVVYFDLFSSSLPGALQSAQTSVLCSFLDISKVAEIERWMTAMMWFALFPPSYRPTSAVNRCGPWIPGSRVVWSAFPASWQLNFPFVLRSLRPRSPLNSSQEPSYVNIVNLARLDGARMIIFTKSVRCIAYDPPRDGSSLPVSFRTHTQHPCSLPMEGQGGVTGQK